MAAAKRPRFAASATFDSRTDTPSLVLSASSILAYNRERTLDSCK